MLMLDVRFKRQNKSREYNWQISSINFDQVTCFDVRIERQHENAVLGIPHNKRNKKQRTENKNFNLSEIMYCGIHSFW